MFVAQGRGGFWKRWSPLTIHNLAIRIHDSFLLAIDWFTIRTHHSSPVHFIYQNITYSQRTYSCCWPCCCSCRCSCGRCSCGRCSCCCRRFIAAAVATSDLLATSFLGVAGEVTVFVPFLTSVSLPEFSYHIASFDFDGFSYDVGFLPGHDFDKYPLTPHDQQSAAFYNHKYRRVATRQLLVTDETSPTCPYLEKITPS